MSQGLQMIQEREVYVTGAGQILDNIHEPSTCQGRPCVIHAPIEGEPWSSWPTLWRWDWGGFMERVCEHGVGHPAVEDQLRGDVGSGGHGCCGCPCGMSDAIKARWALKDEDDMGASEREEDEAAQAWKESRAAGLSLDESLIEAKLREIRERMKDPMRPPAQAAAEPSDVSDAGADMQAKIQALRDDFMPLAQVTLDRHRAGIPADDPVQAALAEAMHRMIVGADSRAVAGLLTGLAWKQLER